ncbi:MAG: hypothetical protein M0033_03490 [Nitrospiraceae bacterium]|nr:hypothetical protein [Nitrospiraceae bacterium]
MEDRRNIPDAIALLNDHDQNIRLLAIDFLQKVVNHLPPTTSLDMLKMHEQEDIKTWKEWWPVNFGNYWESLSEEEKALDRSELPKCVLSSIPDLGMITMVGTLCGPRSPRASWPLEFPPALKKSGIKKTTFTIVFKASPNGEVIPESVKIKKTSGSSLLDSTVMENIK